MPFQFAVPFKRSKRSNSKKPVTTSKKSAAKAVSSVGGRAGAASHKVKNVYHIIKRTNFERNAFPSLQHRVAYLHQLQLQLRRHKVRLHSFALLDTEVHLVLEPLRKLGISKLMQELQSTQARLVNGHEGLSGSLWQAHYLSRSVQQPQDYRATIEFVERAPEQQGLATSAAEYFWSGAFGRIAGEQALYPWTRFIGSLVFEETFRLAMETSRWEKEFAEVDWRAFLNEPDYREQVRAMAREGEEETNTAEERQKATARIEQFIAVRQPRVPTGTRNKVLHHDGLAKRIKAMQKALKAPATEVASRSAQAGK